MSLSYEKERERQEGNKKWKLLPFFAFTALFFLAPSIAFAEIRGNHDGLDCNQMWGWVCDTNNPTTSLVVDLYVDGIYAGMTVSASDYRGDVESVCGGNGYHGFHFDIPVRFQDGGGHSMEPRPAGIVLGSRGYLCGSSAHHCVPSLPNNSVSYGSGEESGLISDLAWQYSASNTGRLCEFYCPNGWTWDAMANSCVAPPNASPIGTFDGVSCSAMWGWTCDADDYSQSLYVSLHSTDNVWSQTVHATNYRSDAQGMCHGNGAVGFAVDVPAILKDGKGHSIVATAANIGGGNNVDLLSFQGGGSIGMSCACVPNNCASNTCSGSVCWNGCTNVPGTMSCACTPNNCASSTCSTTTCWNGCSTVQGTMSCACTPNNCASSTCSTTTCWNGCSTVQGTMNCAVAACGTRNHVNCSDNNYVNCPGSSCTTGSDTPYAGTEPSGQPALALYNAGQWVGWDWKCGSSPVCAACRSGFMWNGSNCVPIACVPTNSCQASTCSTQTCFNGCSNVPGTMDCSAPTCGTASGLTFSSVPTSNLCNPSTTSPVSGPNGYSGGWWWQCSSTGSVCFATRSSSATCGSNQNTYLSTTSAWPSTSGLAFCSSGAVFGGSSTFPPMGGTTNWTCDAVPCQAHRYYPERLLICPIPSSPLNIGGTIQLSARYFDGSGTTDTSSVSCATTSGYTSVRGSSQWSSSPSSVASVGNSPSAFMGPNVKGLVTALAGGTTNIFASYGGVSASVPVTVLGASSQTLSVSVSANPVSGNVPPPLNSMITATVGGTATGTVNYRFYCDGSSLTQTYSNQSATTFSHTCSYASAGTYSPKVEVDRGTAPMATGTADVTVNSAPSFVCNPLTISNAILCTGDNTGLSANTISTVVANSGSCGAPKCEFYCEPGYVKSGNTCVPTPTATLTPSSNSVSNLNPSINLTWSSTNATSCTGSNFNTGGATSGTVSVSPSATTTYGLNCSGPGGSASDSEEITVIYIDPCASACSAASNASHCSGPYTVSGCTCTGTKDCREFWREVRP